MEKSIKKTIISSVFFALCLVLAMIICGSLGYIWAKSKAPQKNDAHVHPKNVQSDGIYAPLKRPEGLREAFAASQSIIESETKDDYLVIAQNGLVNLYVINSDGNKTFEKILEIDKNALTPNDQKLLTQGIILDTREDLLSLLEDYTS